MQYAVLLYVDKDLGVGPGHPEWEACLPGHVAFSQRLVERGVEWSGGALQGKETATSIRVNGNGRQLADAPAVDGDLQLWGYYAIEAPDLDTAVTLTDGFWEAEHGVVELRPLIPQPTGA